MTNDKVAKVEPKRRKFILRESESGLATFMGHGHDITENKTKTCLKSQIL